MGSKIPHVGVYSLASTLRVVELLGGLDMVELLRRLDVGTLKILPGKRKKRNYLKITLFDSLLCQITAYPLIYDNRKEAMH